MTPHEKAVNALNGCLERLQANLRKTSAETAQQFLVQAIVVTLGASEAMTDYIKTVGIHSQRRHGEFKQRSATVGERHAELLKSGKELLEQLKVTPTDKAIRKQIDAAQRDMARIQKDLRREAFALQRELALGVAMIDRVAESVRRFCEADRNEEMQRTLKELISHVRELYTGLEATRHSKGIIDVAAWETSAASAIDQATDFYDAYARAGYQAMLALDVMTQAVTEKPPGTAEEATQRANESVAARLKEITARFAAG